jgi:FKBP-type peptidyl-prolyl cis-trans isomerase 2
VSQTKTTKKDNIIMSKKTKSKKTKSKKVKNGQKVSVHYVGTFEDGTEFDSSRSRNEVMSVEVGSGQLISGFNAALEGMAIGEVKNVKLEPPEAYGEINPEAYQSVPQSSFPTDFDFKIGETIRGESKTGQPMFARIDSVDDDSVRLNFNHPLAGKTLNFEIELVDID